MAHSSNARFRSFGTAYLLASNTSSSSASDDNREAHSAVETQAPSAAEGAGAQ